MFINLTVELPVHQIHAEIKPKIVHEHIHRASRSEIRKTLPPLDTKWTKIVECESSGDWHEHGANGFFGGLQFTVSTWNAFGGTTYAFRADYATASEQIIVAERVLAAQGWAAWPACSSKAGYR